MEFFANIPNIKYQGPDARDELAFRFYNPEAIVGGKTMREQLRFSLAYWHGLSGTGADPFGRGPHDRSWGGKDPMQIAVNKAHAGMEIMDKLGIDFYAFHDRDIAPEGADFAETCANLHRIADLLQELNAKHNKKVLWGTANCFDHPRYMHGAGTSPSPEAFAFAAAQVKNALDVTHQLGGAGYVFWGGREGYETLLNTDMKREQDNLARLLTMAVEYAQKIGFKGDFYIEPKPKEPTRHQYDFDAATVLGFLGKYDLLKYFKLNIEANHATLAGHTFQHDLQVSRINGALGSIDANRGDLLLGWDTDQFPTDVYDTTACMLEVLRAGGFTKGGLNFDAKLRRGSHTPEDIFHGFISGMDGFALGLLRADAMLRDGRIDQAIADRYAGWQGQMGLDLAAGKMDLAACDAFAKKTGEVTVGSGRQELLESIQNSVLFG